MKAGFYTVRGYQQSSHAVLLVVLLILGLTGSILFFPLNMETTETCVFDHLTASGGSGIDMSPVSKTARGSILLHKYMHTYSIWWWLSLGFLSYGIDKLYKIRSIASETDSDLHTVNMGNKF